VEVYLQDESTTGETTLTENVSAHGARVLVERKLPPGQHVLIKSPREGVRSQGRIIYCQRVAESKFVAGIELSGRVEPWARSY
jgi:PilZ domain